MVVWVAPIGLYCHGLDTGSCLVAVAYLKINKMIV